MGTLQKHSIVKGQQVPIFPNLLHKLFEDNVDRKFGDKIALIFRDEISGAERTTNYNTLNSMSNRIASTLLEKIKMQNLQPNGDGDWIICVCMKPSDNLVATLLAIWKCGGKASNCVFFLL
jgi:acyl-coenzyme A synthetase/AMP-(fatty) acid ligase